MATEKGKYNIKAVSNMLGIQPGTLRAWERRYQIIRPVRNNAGHRLYTDHHVRILKWLIAKVDHGFTISQAVSLYENNQGETLNEPETGQDNELEKKSSELLEALLSFDERTAQQHLDYAFSLYTPEKVAIEIISPLLIKVGVLWEENKITSAHEHFASSFLRSRIGMLLLSIPAAPYLPKAVLVCGPNEKHELGLLIFALFLKRKGYEVIYLGQSIADGDIQPILKEVDAAYVFLSTTLKKNVPATIMLAETIQKNYPGMRVGLGGYAFDQLDPDEKAKADRFLVGTTREEWLKWLDDQR
ncbi:MerR family transcriptional regulator [Thalassobacillus devorans]|uniref:MerR family transcriptional regulator n=1 Tax=Thalassobacillus devorans TaxID=279813 RepID=A0ABQ1NY31_9BACI|nr:MerR family transcriptional regulator [Thalassobacillus devorans]NIK28336.1 DNA-binding transcriptional MerR regulator/methylmalonyl-CoA mutase cobalamin-binding subunit [Thalassobacillus devorans]GGC87096.1 MerR family transcriptional regulator [Thalassobacillus devorans]